MKCGLFTGAALLCAMDWLADLSAGGLAWARAPETISALMATDIVRVLSIGASKAGDIYGCRSRVSLPASQRRRVGHVPSPWNLVHKLPRPEKDWKAGLRAPSPLMNS